jgi:ATP-dependent helicase/DNAse subunit B
MTATVRILCGPAGAGKTRRLLDLFRRQIRAAPGAALWLSPTRRAVDVVRARLMQGETALWAAGVCTFQDFVEELIHVNDPQARELSGVQRRLFVEDVVARVHVRRSLSRFERVADTRGFMDGLLTLLAELQRGDVPPIQFARAAYPHGDKARQFARIYATYQKELNSRHLLDVEGRTRHACKLLAEGQRRPFDKLRVVFVDDFNDFALAQHDVLQQLCRWIDEMWIALPDEARDERAELFSQPRATRLALERLVAETEFVESEESDETRPAAASDNSMRRNGRNSC